MNSIILTMISLSVSGTILAIILLALQLILKNRVSKTFQYYIWLVVLLRLALPVSFEGSIVNKLIPESVRVSVAFVPEYVGNGALMQTNLAPQVNEQTTSPQSQTTETVLSDGTVPNSSLPAVPKQEPFRIWKFAFDHLTFIWLGGALLHFGWFIIAYLRLNRKIIKTNVQPHAWDTELFTKMHGNKKIKLACNPYIDTPMLTGFLSPCIVIPQLAFVVNGMEPELQHILSHELTHFRRRDLLYKWFAVFVSSLHWFNPLMILVRREIGRNCELSCDEAVIRSLGTDERMAYGETLLAIASNKRRPLGMVTTTMCKGKRELKERLEGIMTYKRKSIFMVALTLVLSMVLVGCSMALGAAKVTYQTSEPVESPAATDSVDVADDEAAQSSAATDLSAVPASASSSSLDGEGEDPQIVSDRSVLEAYKAVLKNQTEFFSTDTNKNLYLNDFLTNKEIYSVDFDVTHFTVLDMDGDAVPEAVLELSVGDQPQFYEILHATNEGVSGYLVVYRGLQGLKADGTFIFSSGAADSGWGKLRFDSNTINTDKLGYSESTQTDDELAISYYINNDTVTQDAFDAAIQEQIAKDDAAWYDFDESSIEAQFS